MAPPDPPDSRVVLVPVGDPLDHLLDNPLDNPVRASLLGPHHRYAVGDGNALAYRPEYSAFAAVPGDPADEDWAALARLVGPRGVAVLFGSAPPCGWVERRRFDALQMVVPATGSPDSPVPEPVTPEPGAPDSGAPDSGAHDSGAPDLVAPDPGLVELGPDDVDEVLDLVSRAEPGPFLARTLELGRYLGRRVDGRLEAMAGERMRFAGWAEVSAVCTDSAFRGQGLGGRLVRAVVAGAAARGDGTFLHVMGANVGAIRLYRSLGFVVRRPVTIVAVSPPRPGQRTRFQEEPRR